MNEVIVSVPHGPGVVSAGAKHSRAWWRLAVVAVVGALVLSFNWGSRLLLTNDDTRFPVLAGDVLVNGHWLLPAFPDGTFHLVKPPLAVWLIAIASWPTGSVSVRTAMLPSLLAAIGVVLLTYWLGCRLFGPDPGAVGGLTVTTMVGVYTMAHSSMPDMVQLVFGTGAIAAYVATGFAANRAWLVLFYGLIGLGSLAKGIAGFVPLAVVIGDTIIAHGAVGLRRLVSIPGWVVLAGLAVPWWIVAAASAGHNRFVHGFVLNDQLLSYFGRDRWDRQAIAEPISFAVTVLLPWGLLLPFAIRRALREADPDTVRRVRLLLVWLATVFVIMVLSGKQRERYYLPLCPPAALLIAWWYSTLAWRGRARAFAGAWIAVAAAGVVVVKLDTPHFNVTSDLRAVRAVLSQAPAPLYSLDLQDLALSFNLDRPVVNAKTLQRFEDRVRQGEMGYLIISDRALATKPGDPCMRSIARGLVTRQPFTVLDPAGCGWRPLSSDDRRAG
jgi:4-amino-4-deoxy-L-arabinose transferase-like glycosyltransferase